MAKKLEGKAWLASKEMTRFDQTIALAVIMPVTATALIGAGVIRVVDGVHPFYRQKRYGDPDKAPIEVVKLQTMNGEETNTGSTGPNDPRRTKVGKILAKSHIDEFFQLWKVLSGDLSIVGPRPFTLETIEKMLDLLNAKEQQLFLDTGIKCHLTNDFRGARRSAPPGILDPFAAFAYHTEDEVSLLGMALGQIEYVGTDTVTGCASRETDLRIIRSAAPLVFKGFSLKRVEKP